MRDPTEIERAVTDFARSPNAGLIVPAGGSAQLHRNLIITLAARHKLPAVYYERFFVAAGGLISYGSDFINQYRRSASYVDRILRGEKPADLPVQAPTKYELVINLKTAKALGLEVRRHSLCAPTIANRGIKATSIGTHFDDSAKEWSSLLGRRSSHLEAPLRRGFFCSPASGDHHWPRTPSRLESHLPAYSMGGRTRILP